ncbi:MAG TPA: hypothetical protein VF069_23055 [Streptosporangiaceae bacterium]
MGVDTGGNRGADAAEAYWRRRAIALGGVLAMVGLVAWACAGGGDRSAARRPVDAAALSTPSAHTLPTVLPTATVTVTARTTVRTTVRPVPRKKAGDGCEPRDLVVGLVTTKTVYAGKERPTFRLTAVNTGRRPCTFGVGPKELEVRVSSGPDRVWTSARCARGSGSSIRLLRRGLPYIVTVVWDRRRSGDCAGRRAAARPGTYVVTVRAGKVRVRGQVFGLR